MAVGFIESCSDWQQSIREYDLNMERRRCVLGLGLSLLSKEKVPVVRHARSKLYDVNLNKIDFL